MKSLAGMCPNKKKPSYYTVTGLSFDSCQRESVSCVDTHAALSAGRLKNQFLNRSRIVEVKSLNFSSKPIKIRIMRLYFPRWCFSQALSISDRNEGQKRWKRGQNFCTLLKEPQTWHRVLWASHCWPGLIYTPYLTEMSSVCVLTSA